LGDTPGDLNPAAGYKNVTIDLAIDKNLYGERVDIDSPLKRNSGRFLAALPLVFREFSA
jgi:hypothetical protein